MAKRVHINTITLTPDNRSMNLGDDVIQVDVIDYTGATVVELQANGNRINNTIYSFTGYPFENIELSTRYVSGPTDDYIITINVLTLYDDGR
jgi:hypothetical protein